MPSDFQHISPLVSQANLSCLRQVCQLDGDVTSPTAHDDEPPTPTTSSASSLTQQECEFQKAVQPGSPILVLLSSPRQPLMVAPGGIGVVCGEPTLLHKLQATRKDAAKSPAKALKATARLQEIVEEGAAGAAAVYKKQGDTVQMKELQSQKARIIAQMVPAQAPHSTTNSPFKDAENIIPAPVPETTQGEQRVRMRTKENLSETHLPMCFCVGADGQQHRQAALLLHH
jgi:cell cycle serine/threonine-protein kinase CDC5/MSD2